jgi:CheY-like chemotaxis protein/acyl-CoA reductase-like NAD-dependent aldehyde dehydrogenase
LDKLDAMLSRYEEPGEESTHEINKPYILVADDDESMRRGLNKSLSPRYQVVTAENGKTAIEEFSNHEFHAVILDIKMPGMSGFEVCRELDKLKPDVPIIFYTAFQGEHDIQAILNIYRPFAYLDKGGKYDLSDSVRNAVERYSEFLEKVGYQKELEARLTDLGFSLTDTKAPDLINIPNIIGKEKIWPREKGGIRITDFNTHETLGCMPDLSDDKIQEAIHQCHEQGDRWRRLTVLERLEVIAEAGEKLARDDRFDRIIPRSGCFSRKVSVSPDRKLTAQWMQRSVEYMKWAFGSERVEADIIEGVGTVGIIIQSSMFQTGAYGIIEALRAGNSLLVKLDSRDPYPEYLVASTLVEAGAPVQIISFDTKKKPHAGRRLIDGLDRVVFMGNPDKIIEIAYGEAIQQLNTTGGISSEDLTNLKRKLLIPAKVISYTAHVGGAYIHKDAGIGSAIRDCIYSSISHYRSCKRLKVLTIHPDIYDNALNRLKTEYGALKIGTTRDPDVDLVVPGRTFRETFIGPYLEQAALYGRIVYGTEPASMPKIIELDPENLTRGEGIKRFLGQECMFPHLIVIKGDEKIAIYATRLMAENSHDGMILEYSVFTTDKELFRFVEKYGYAFNYHLNEPTTWGLGNPDRNKFRFHQRRILAMDLAGTRVG